MTRMTPPINHQTYLLFTIKMVDAANTSEWWAMMRFGVSSSAGVAHT